MTEYSDRKLPVGIQSFEEIRKGEYIYVDKTDIIWQLANKGNKYNYLSRPRRFGKSVLVDTLEAYFTGRKELFEGLKIMELEKDWMRYPVVRLDMSNGGDTANELRSYLESIFKTYEEAYAVEVDPDSSLTVRFSNIIETASKTTGQKVVILIDEYDSPLQHSWKTPHHEECTRIYRSVFSVLKSQDYNERFVFITGITKFTQISLFSVLNNLSNISFEPQYAAICGITKDEVAGCFKPEIEKLAEYEGWTFDEAVAQLKAYYDGYHFSRRNMVDVFNPFSLINALADSDLKNYWASSGATSLLPKFVDDMEIKLGNFDPCTILRQTIETSDVTGAEPSSSSISRATSPSRIIRWGSTSSDSPTMRCVRLCMRQYCRHSRCAPMATYSQRSRACSSPCSSATCPKPRNASRPSLPTCHTATRSSPLWTWRNATA